MEKRNQNIFENVTITSIDLLRALGGMALDVISTTRRGCSYYPAISYEHPLDTPLEQITQWGEESNGQLVLDFDGNDA